MDGPLWTLHVVDTQLPRYGGGGMRDVASDGQGMVEYGLIIALVALTAAAGFILLGEGLLQSYNGIVDTVGGFLGV